LKFVEFGGNIEFQAGISLGAVKVCEAVVDSEFYDDVLFVEHYLSGSIRTSGVCTFKDYLIREKSVLREVGIVKEDVILVNAYYV
jgi:hypothetical protein